METLLKLVKQDQDLHSNDKDNSHNMQNKFLYFIAFVLLSDGSVYGIYRQHDDMNALSSSNIAATNDKKFISTPTKT